MRTRASSSKSVSTPNAIVRVVVGGIAVLAVSAGPVVPTPTVEAVAIRGAGHVDMAWSVTDASGQPPPATFGPRRGGPWGGTDRIWSQPGFTGSYRISVDGVEVAGYCGDFHNAAHPDAASTWVPDRTAFAGSDKAWVKLSYAQWRWGATTDPDVAAALALYTHFLGSPDDRSNSSGVPVPDIDDDDVVDEIVTVSAPHAAVGPILSVIDAAAEAWSAAFDHRSSNLSAGVTVEIAEGAPRVTATATGQVLPAGSFDLTTTGRRTTVVTAGLARPLRDTTAGSQNTITAGAPHVARASVPLDVAITSQVSDASPPIGATLSDAITITGLGPGDTATVRVELFDLSVDRTGSGAPLATEVRVGLVDGTTTGWTPHAVTTAAAGRRLGYRHRLEAITPTDEADDLPGPWSELGIASETATVAQLDAVVHLRTTISSSSRPTWVNAQRGSEPGHTPSAAAVVPADGSHDDQEPDVGDALAVFVAGDSVTTRYEVWLDERSTGDVVWPGPAGERIVVDDAGTVDAADDISPSMVGGDDGDGRLAVGEVWVFEARDHRRALAGERYVNLATVVPGRIADPVTGVPTERVSTSRGDPAGYVVPCLSTSVVDPADGDRILGPDGGVVVDVVTFCHLVPGEQYVVEGIVVERASGEPTGFRGSTAFVADAPDGTVDVKIDVKIDMELDVEIAVRQSGASRSGEPHRYVVFETLTLARDGALVATHADLDDPAQTFEVAARAEPPSTAPPSTAPPGTTPPNTGPPRVERPPAIPRVGSDAAHLVTLGGIGSLTAGVMLMELRHGRIHPRAERGRVLRR